MTVESHDKKAQSIAATLRFAAGSGAWIVPHRPGAPPVAEVAVPEPFDGETSRARKLDNIRARLGACTRCRLHQGRAHVVFGVGNPEARLMFVGEGPGEEEDKRGEPFVGPAGQLLDKMIAAMGYERSAVYIANVVKCRPPKNRDPKEDEIDTCLPFLWEQIDAIAPEIIIALGAHAARTLTGSELPIGRLRGRVHSAHGHKILATYHPAYLLRTPTAKRMAWEDLQKAMALLAP